MLGRLKSILALTMKEAGYAFDSLPLYHRTKVKMCEFKVNKALKCKNETAIQLSQIKIVVYKLREESVH